MTGRSFIRRFVIAFAVTVLVTAVVLRTRLVERVSYQIEHGRLAALRDSSPDALWLEQMNRSNREVASMVTPAVVRITAVRDIQIGDMESLVSGSANSGEGLDFEALHPWIDGDGREESEGGRRRPGPARSMQVQETGSGFVFDAAEGLVLTNHHVIAEASRIEVVLEDGRRYESELVGSDAASDLAVLRIPDTDLIEVTFGDSGALAVGDEVFAVGNPFGLSGSVSRGIVSALGRTTQIQEVRYQGFIQTDAVINPGNSGGPLVNRRGEVVGVNTAIATRTGHHDGVGFAIPAARVLSLLPKLRAGGSVVRGFLGVSTVDIRDERRLAVALGWHDLRGAIVAAVWPDTPAAQGGVEVNDVLIEIDGHRIENGTDLMDFVAVLEPGTTSELTYWRDGAVGQTTVTLSTRPGGY